MDSDNERRGECERVVALLQEAEVAWSPEPEPPMGTIVCILIIFRGGGCTDLGQQQGDR